MGSIDSDSRTVLWARLVGLSLFLLVVAAVAVLGGAESLRAVIDDLAGGGWAGVASFVALYALATVMLVPGSLSTVVAGALYGTVLGAAVSVAGATLGASVAYAIARSVGRRPARALVGCRGARLDAWLAERQLRTTVVLRLLPVVPFNLLNYGAGLSPVRPRPYVAGTALGIGPGALMAASVGSSARQPASPAFALSVAVAVASVAGSALLARRWARR